MLAPATVPQCPIGLSPPLFTLALARNVSAITFDLPPEVPWNVGAARPARGPAIRLLALTGCRSSEVVNGQAG